MPTTIDETVHTDEAVGRRMLLLLKLRPFVFYLSLTLAALMAVAFLPELLATIVTGFTADTGAELGEHRLHIMGIAAVVGAFLLGLGAQVYRPTNRVAAMWGSFLIILTASLGTVVYGVGRPEEVLPFMAVTGIALVAHPAGSDLIRRGSTYSPAMLGMLAVAAIPIAVFVVAQQSLTMGGDSHATMGHYVMMTALVIAPLAYGIFAALGFTGWRLAAWLAGIPIAYYGILSIAFPMQSGSSGVIWGAAAIGWAVVFVGIAEYSRRAGAETTMIRRPVREAV